ncbi:MAG: DUF4097 family beta strand repeat-containing protein [Bryobacteraceae bacterium]
MKNLSLILTAGALLMVPAQAAWAAPHTCSANNFHVNDLVSYAETREQHLTPQSTNAIDPGANGSVVVHGWSNNDVLVKACIQTAAGTDSEARALASQVEIARGPGQIKPHGPSSDSHHYWDLSYEVWVPNHSNLEISANNGSISIETVEGKIQFRTLNGSVHLAQVGGDVDGTTTNGSLHVDLAGSSWTGRGLNATTTNGSIQLNVPENYSANVETSTVNGRVHVDFPVKVSGDVGKRLSFQLGSGGATIQARTTNGGVHISRT